MRRFAISDIHGCARTFGKLLDKIGLKKEDQLYLLGDFIDRGPDSKGVFDRILQIRELGYRVDCLLGNHEEMMLNALNGGREREHLWWMNGGMETLNSFEVNSLGEVPEVYLDFIASMSHFIALDDYILVHAGLNFKASDPLEDIEPMLWIRDWYRNIDRQWLGEKIVVHGHTPIPETRVRQQLKNVERVPAVDIDNGCVYDRPGHNQLCALNLDNRELIFQKNIDGN